MSRASAVVFAYSNVGARCLRVLRAHDIDVKLVVTHADNPKEMKKRIQNLLNEVPSEELPIILKVIRAIVR